MDDVIYALEHDDVEMFDEEAPRGFFIPPPADTRPEILRSSPTIIAYAAYYGATEILLHLVDVGFSVTNCDDLNRDAIHFASAKGNTNIVSLMLSSEMGSNQDSYLRTPLHYASENGCYDTVNLLLSDPIAVHTVNSRDAEGNTPIHLAGSVSVLNALLKYNANTHARNSAGETPLFTALYNGNKDVASELLEQDPDLIKNTSYDGSTALHAAAHGGKSCVQLVLRECRKLLHKNTKTNRTPLHAAAEGGFVGAVITIIKAGCDVDAADIDGITPLHIACGRGNAAAAQILLENGADPSLVDRTGRNALHFAAEGGVDCVSLIMDRVDVKARTVRGSTAAHIAAEAGDHHSLSILLPMIGPDEVDGCRRTALSIASAAGFEECVCACIDAGARTDIVDNRGLSPLDAALLRTSVLSEEYELPSVASSPIVMADKVAGPIVSAGGVLSPKISRFIRPRKRICLSQKIMSDDSSPNASQYTLSQTGVF